MIHRSGKFLGVLLSSIKKIFLSRKIRIITLILILPILFHVSHTLEITEQMDGLSQSVFRLYAGDIRSSQTQKYVLPITWIFINAYIAFTVGDHPVGTAYKREIHFLLCSENRSYWWLANSIGTCCLILTIYIIIYAEAFVAAVVYNLPLGGSSDTSFVTFMLLPLVSMSFSLLQSLLNLRINPIFSYIIVIVLQVWSTVSFSPWLLGYYLQTVRLSQSSFSANLVGMIYALLAAAIYILIGSFVIRKTNIM